MTLLLPPVMNMLHTEKFKLINQINQTIKALYKFINIKCEDKYTFKAYGIVSHTCLERERGIFL